MSGKKIAVLSSRAIVLIAGAMPVSVGTLATTVAVGGGAVMMTGCSSDRSDSRQDARTGARTSERTEQRVEDRND